jgi:diguanylate cyclase (GGDEF)-like protein
MSTAFDAAVPDVLLFEGAPGAWERVRACPRRRLVPGQVLIAPGRPARELYLVLWGELAVHVDTVDQDSVATVGPGCHCGEVALVDGLDRSAWVVASVPTEVLVVPEPLFWDLVQRYPQVAINALRSMAAKVRGGNSEVSESRRLQAEYKRHASYDALTGLYNRRWLDDVLPRLVQRARTDRQPLAAVMVDVDHFKKFNDTHGHAAGDYVLFAVGQQLRRSFRPTDLVARYGGEEFTVVLPETTGEQAVLAADRVRRALADEPLLLEDGPRVRVTASMGVAQLSLGQDADAMLRAADRALYQAKEAGRNRVCSWGAVLTEPLPGLL